MKRCSECGEMKPLSEFNRLTRSADGHQPRCRACFSAYNAARYADPMQKEAAKRRASARRVDDPIAVLHSRLVTHSRKATKRTANRCVEAAVLAGVLVKPGECDECGSYNADFGVYALHAHHDDYGKPLDVRWLCPKCHAAAHPEKWERIKCEACGRNIARSAMARHVRRRTHTTNRAASGRLSSCKGDE